MGAAGNSGNLPTNIPWTGSSGCGGSYGPSEYACDGKELAEIECGFEGGAVVRWDYTLNEPNPESLGHIRHYIDVLERANEALVVTEVAK